MTNKKCSAGTVVSLIAAVLAVVTVILYFAGVNAEGYFQHQSVSVVPACSAAAIACLVLAPFVSTVGSGTAGKLAELVGGLLKIAAPALLAYCLISIVGARAEGLGFIYFSNADVAKEVQTAANLSSATKAITTMAGYGVSMLAGIIAAFFNHK